MNRRQDGLEVSVAEDMDNIDTILKTFWEKARFAAELIARLREEKRTLQDQCVKLQDELQKIHSDLSGKEQELKRLRAEHAQILSSISSDVFTTQDKDELKNKIRDLIAKINSYL